MTATIAGSWQSATRETISFTQLKSSVGAAGGVSDWLLVDQARIDAFAAATGDDAFIHTDPARAATTRFGGTIAHGLFTLSVLPWLIRSAIPLVEGTRMGVNYGYDRVRFVEPVPVNSRIRATGTLIELKEHKPGFFLLTYDAKVEIEAKERPACTARWLIGRWMESA